MKEQINYLIDKRIKSFFKKINLKRRLPAIAVENESNGYVAVKLVGDQHNNIINLLNKTGENILKGDSVWVTHYGKLTSNNAVVSQKNGTSKNSGGSKNININKAYLINDGDKSIYQVNHQIKLFPPLEFIFSTPELSSNKTILNWHKQFMSAKYTSFTVSTTDGECTLELRTDTEVGGTTSNPITYYITRVYKNGAVLKQINKSTSPPPPQSYTLAPWIGSGSYKPSGSDTSYYSYSFTVNDNGQWVTAVGISVLNANGTDINAGISTLPCILDVEEHFASQTQACIETSVGIVDIKDTPIYAKTTN